MADSDARLDFVDLWDFRDPAGSERRFRDLLPAARESGDITYLAELLTQVARAEALQSSFDKAQRTLDEVETLLPEAGQRARIRYLLERGRAFNSSDHPAEASGLFLEAWELGREQGEDFLAVDAAHMVAIVEQGDGRIEWNLRAMEYAERSDNPRARGWLGSLYNNLGWAYHDQGRYEEALTTFHRALEWHRAQEGKGWEMRVAAWTVGRALRSLGRYEEALRVQEENLRELERVGEPDGYVEEEIGECLLALGRKHEAVPHLTSALALLSEDPWLAVNEPDRLQRLRVLLGIVP